MRQLLQILAAACLVSHTDGQKRAFTLADLYKIRNVEDPQFSPDGHWPSGVKSMPFYYNAHLDWFHTYLGGDPAPYDMTKMLRNQAMKDK